MHCPALQRTALHTANISITTKRHTQLFHPTDRYTPTHCHMLPQTTHMYTNPIPCTATHCSKLHMSHISITPRRHTQQFRPTDRHAATHCHTLPHAATRCHTCTHIYYPALRRTAHITYIYYPQAILSSFIPRRQAHCNALQHTAPHCNTLQQTTHSYLHLLPQNDILSGFIPRRRAHCNALHHTAPHYTHLLISNTPRRHSQQFHPEQASTQCRTTVCLHILLLSTSPSVLAPLPAERRRKGEARRG